MVRSRIEVQNGNDELTFDGGMVTIGGRTGVDVVLRDPMVADRHCVITCENGFIVRDTGSVTGTWVNGQRAGPEAVLQDGATIVIGTTKVQVSVADDSTPDNDGTSVLKLSVETQSFWWKKASKDTFDNDPDQLVYSETKFGRFPALHLSNRIAMVVGAVVLIGATLLSTVMEPLADPGPLQPSHALILTSSPDGSLPNGAALHAGFQKCVELAGEQGCDVCHTTGSGAPERKCAQCHGLPGEMAAAGSFRHPYHDTGRDKNAGRDQDQGLADQQFCVRCHTDHTGNADLKAGATDLVGKCASCHNPGNGKFDREELIKRAKIELAPQQQTEFAALRFPHDQHLAKEITCDICHTVDVALVEDRERGVPDDPFRHDYGVVAYEICASCHIDEADAVNMTVAQQKQWRAEDARWTVRWHGSRNDQGEQCMQCHTASQSEDAARTRAGAVASKVFGPDLKTVRRGDYSVDLYQRERARYTSPARSHDQQFKNHGEGQACTQCHLDGQITTTATTSRPTRTFWHALHVVVGSLSPNDAGSDAGLTSCVSCHDNLGEDAASNLTPLADGPYHWPGGSEEQAACRECHRNNLDAEALQALRLTAAGAKTTAKTIEVPDFPHAVHVGSSSFGAKGSLQQGCFACHEFSRPTAEDAFSQVPRIKAGARDCTSCHGGHDDIAGGDCQQCHPKADGMSNSFLVQASIKTPAWPTRPWPAPNGFSHLSAGHKDETCASCHQDSGLDEADALTAVRVPDEGAKLCRDCHLNEQFHWR